MFTPRPLNIPKLSPTIRLPSLRSRASMMDLLLRKGFSSAGGGLDFVTGEYTGDGAATQAIIGVGFQPKFLFVYAQTLAIPAGWGNKTDQDGTKTHVWGYSAASINREQYEDDHIISFNPDGFTVGDGTGSALATNVFNIAATVYTYVAFRAGVQMATGTYTGNGAATQGIIGVGFQSKWALIYDQSGLGNPSVGSKTDQDGLFAWYQNAGDGREYAVNQIISLDANGFTVTDRFNLNLRVYTYVCFRGIGLGNLKTGQYVGNNAPTQAVAGVGFQPKSIIIWRTDNANVMSPLYASNQDAGNAIIFWANSTFLWNADMLVSFDADGFTVGDGSFFANRFNILGVTYTYVAFN